MFNSFRYPMRVIDPLKSLPGYALRRASAAVHAELCNWLAPFDLRPTDASILMLVAANRGITQSELGRILDIQRANMTPLTARLAERGLFDRERLDGRSHGLVLTPAGQALTDQVRAKIHAYETDLTTRVPHASRPHILAVLHALWAPEEPTG